MTRLWFSLLAVTVRLSLQCANIPGDSECGRAVIMAMTHDFVLHPNRFIGLSVKSSYTDFQAYYHNAGMYNCPRPCFEMEQACVPWSVNFPGMGQIKGMRSQMANHPNWWPELSSKSSDREIAKALYTRGQEGIPRVCEADEAPGHHVPYEAPSKHADADSNDPVMNAVQELLDRRKQAVRNDDMADWGVSEAGSSAESTDGWRSDDDKSSSEDGFADEDGESSEDGWAADDGEDESAWNDEADQSTADSESKEASDSVQEVSSKESTDQTAKETEEVSPEEKPEEAKTVEMSSKETTDQTAKETEEVSPEEKPEEAKAVEMSSKEATDQTAKETEDSGDGEDYGADVQWPSHQSHHTMGYKDESQDGYDTGAGLFVDGMREIAGKQTACFHRGRSYSLLDVPEHIPQTVAGRDACQAQCVNVGAGHFLFHEPTNLCHCPPQAALPVEVGSEFVSGDVDCINSGIVGKWSAALRDGATASNLTRGPLVALIGCSMLALVIPMAVIFRKVSRAGRSGDLSRFESSSGFTPLDPLTADLEGCIV